MIAMKMLTIENIEKVTKGIYHGPEEILRTEVTGVYTDSRKVIEGSLFIPIVGERVDGHSFISNVFEQGALCTLSERELENSAYPYIQVESSLQALKDIAEFYLEQLDTKVVGVTGSVGKTSTKEMIASVLEQSFKILKTDGNFNNEIGLPLTVFRLTGEEEIAILEMGISDFGEMSRLTKIAKPDVAVITNIGLCHLENLKTRDGILKAKTEIFEGLKESGSIVLNGDDDKLATVTAYKNNSIVFFGNEAADNKSVYTTQVKSLGLRGTSCTICTPKGDMQVTVPVPGIHMVTNATAACAVGLSFDMELEEIKKGIESLKQVSGRVNIISTEKFTIIDDCYNANPVSMKSSIDILKDALGRKVCILGDMFELGENEEALHREVGAYVKEKGIDVLVTIGNLSRCISEAAQCNVCDIEEMCPDSGQSDCQQDSLKTTCVHYPTKQDAFKEFGAILKDGDSILVKASHGMEFPEVVEFLKGMK